MSAIVNNFRIVGEYTTQPSYLKFYKTLEDVEVFHSEFNTLVYVLHPPTQDRYLSIEYQGTEGEETDNDIIRNIQTYFPKE